MSHSEVCNLIYKYTPRIIGIDGDLGAGKTVFAIKLSKKYGFSCIHLDNFMHPGQGEFVESLDIRELKNAIQETKGQLIIEGACLKKVLDKLDIKPDLHFFLVRNQRIPIRRSSFIYREVEEYISKYSALETSDLRVDIMPAGQTNQLDVDIAYIRAKTIVSVVLALGGIAAILVGAQVLISGIESQNTTVINILGAEVTAKGIGAVILSSSILWAYFAYLSRPNYSRTREIRNSSTPDGGHESYEFDTATMVRGDRKRNSA